MSKKEITKPQLIALIQRWSAGEISTDAFQGWMLDNYEPMDVEIGKGEPEYVREAMNIVMNEYELADEAIIVPSQASLAVAFIECEESSFNQTKKRFIQEAFTD